MIDLAPTILEIAGAHARPTCSRACAQMPVHGKSLRTAFARRRTRRAARDTQYFEMLGHRGIWHAGWKAVTRHTPGKPFDDDEWELYDLTARLLRVRTTSRPTSPTA